jgi:choline dehydrogenase-like flavoprotein
LISQKLINSPETVLIIENGYIDDSPATSIPYLANMLNTDAMYSITSAPEPYLNKKTFRVSVGNVVGGSIVNGMAWVRGSDADYDAWEELGNPGWGWAGLGPYFKKTSHFTPPSDSSRKKFNITYDASAYGNGLVQASIPSFQYDDYIPIFNSYRAENVPMPIEGFANPVGVYWLPNDIDNATATRSHARITYYDPIQTRSNLKLLTGTKVNKLLFDDDIGRFVAKGVRITSRNDNSVANVYAKKEVILAAGAIFTPQLRMLSGIGPKDVLNAAQIVVKKDAPSVGSNFQDHPPLSMNFSLSTIAFPNPYVMSNNATFNADAAALYAKNRSGPYSFGRVNAAAFLAFKHFSPNYKTITAKISKQDILDYLPERYTKSKALLAGFRKQRGILINRLLGDEAATGETPVQPWGRSSAVLEKPLSRGTITLNTSDPQANPIVQWNALQNPIDAEILCELVRWNRKHWARTQLSAYAPIEAAPGDQYRTNEEIIQQAVESGILTPTLAHLSGSCAMMPEALGGCVSDQLLVYGVENLSIVDASIIPQCGYQLTPVNGCPVEAIPKLTPYLRC